MSPVEVPIVLRSALLLCAFLTCLSGCASAPAEAPMESAATTGELTVVVVYESLGAVPARGTVTSHATMEPVDFDTRSTPDEGQTLHLEAGQYTVAVQGRYLPSGSLQPVKGERVLYLEADAQETLRVVVSDREDMGRTRSKAPARRLPASKPRHAREASSSSRVPLS